MNVSKGKKELIYFFILTYFISWSLWLPAVLGLGAEDSFVFKNSKSLVKLGSFAPSFVAFFLTFLWEKTEGVKSLFKKVMKIRFYYMWYLYIFLLMPCITLVSLLITNLDGNAGFPSLILPVLSTRPWLVIPVLLYFITMQGPLGEEFGWRGYALERLLFRRKQFASSIILGIIWAVWHLPLFFIQGSIQCALAQQGIAIAFIGYVFYTVMLTILITILYCKTGGSVLSAMLFHAMSNFSHGLFTVITTPLGGAAVIVLLFLITLIIVLINKKDFFDRANNSPKWLEIK